MTIWDVLRALTRRWYVVLLAFAVATTASYAIRHQPGVYWSRAEVTFLAPTSANNPNSLQTTSTDLVITAGLVAKNINGNRTWNKVSDPSATIVGQGIYDGWIVRLPDEGGQWSRYYGRQVLDVEVSGPSEEAVRSQQAELFRRIDAALRSMQVGVAASDRITTTVVPATPNVYYMPGRRTMAIGMVWLLAGAIATALVVEIESRRPALDSIPTRHLRRGRLTIRRRAEART